MTRVEIGKVCHKGGGPDGGGHSAFIGEDDYGSCGAHYYATIYVDVEIDVDGGNPRSGDREYTAEDAAKEIARIVEERQKYSWDSYELSELKGGNDA